MKITKELMERLVFEEENDDDLYEHFDTQSEGMNSHGLVETVVIITRKSDGKLFAFLCEQGSEECFFDYDDLFEVESEEVTVIKYKRKDGKRFFN